jgi:DNA polymerase-3 subunit delta'
MRFSEIEGQTVIKQKLIGTVLEQRVSHAQLFFGPEGSGKLALAIAYAQFINCTDKQFAAGQPSGSQQPAMAEGLPADSCGICPSCVKYQKLVHPDLHFIYPVSTTKRVPKKPQSKHFTEDWRKFLLENGQSVTLQGWYEAIEIENKQGIINAEDCNEIITALSYKSYESDYKVMVLWMVERLYYAAAPKILKILEEPPEKTLFLLISDDPDQIIRTILSRTLMVKIPGQGSVKKRSAEDEELFLSTFRQWMLWCYNGNLQELIGFAGEIAKTGREKEKSLLIYGLGILGQCAAYNFSQGSRVVSAGKELEFISKFSRFITAANLPAFNELFNNAIFHIERNAHGPTLFLDLSLKIVRIFKPNFVPLS